MELTPRLRTVAEFVPSGAEFADIGTDHAYLPAWLILCGKIEHAIAADLRSGPLERARETAEKYAVSDRMDFRLCDGLTAIKPGEADTVAIAGMGGETIAHILSFAPWTKDEGITLILQPMSSQEDLRRWLSENGYVVEVERVVREEKTFYTVLVAKGGADKSYSEGEYLVGKNSNDPLRGEYLDFMIGKLCRALQGQRSASSRDEAAIARNEEILNELEEMKKEWTVWQR